ncbi:MAG: hypothetical protein WAK82_09340, partial [Streptosporangiaceae bacterium]
MDTERDQSSVNSDVSTSPAEERQHAGTFQWGDPANVVPPWSVPPGLMVPAPRQPQPVSESHPEDNAWP